MKKKIKLLLALVMSLTMVFGMSTTAFAAGKSDQWIAIWPTEEDEPTTCECTDSEHANVIHFYATGSVYFVEPMPRAEGIRFSKSESGTWERELYYDGDDHPSKTILATSLNGAHIPGCDLYSMSSYDIQPGWYYFDSSASTPPWYYQCNGHGNSGSGNGDDGTPSVPSCDHDFVWQTITAPTATTYGTEGNVCSKCGATKDVRVKSPLDDWVRMQINNAKPGDVLTIDFGPWNSYPLWMMQMIADKPTVTYVFKYTYQGNKYEVTIKPGDKFALDCDWYGPLKMPTLFDTVITKW